MPPAGEVSQRAHHVLGVLNRCRGLLRLWAQSREFVTIGEAFFDSW